MGLSERRLREKELRKQQILDAARELILKHGVFSVSVQEIAKLAELSVGTIYLYFASKEEIFANLQEEILEILFSDTSKAVKNVSDPVERIRLIACEYKRFSEEKRQYFDVVNYFISPSDIFFPKNLKSRIDQQGNRVLAFLVDAINEGAKKGIFDKVDAKRCAIILWGTLHGLIQFKKLKETILKNENFDEIYSYSVEYFIRGLVKNNPVPVKKVK